MNKFGCVKSEFHLNNYIIPTRWMLYHRCICRKWKHPRLFNFSESKLFYFDPHTIQPYVDVTKPDEDDTSFHLPYPSTIEISQLDPSLAVVRHLFNFVIYTNDYELKIDVNCDKGRSTIYNTLFKLTPMCHNSIWSLTGFPKNSSIVCHWCWDNGV